MILPSYLTALLWGFVFVLARQSGARQPALDALVSDDKVTVESNNEDAEWLSFLPTNQNNRSIGVIFMPGGFVDEKAYATICRPIAEQGYPIFIATFPFGLSLFGLDVTNRIMEQYADPLNISVWSIGGHSLGAVGASVFLNDFDNAASTTGKIKGMFLLGATAEGDFSNQTDLSVLLVRGSRDAVITEVEVQENLPMLPPSSTKYVVIPGGNHYEMGTYGIQFQDNEATISREAQQAVVVEEMLEHLTGL